MIAAGDVVAPNKGKPWTDDQLRLVFTLAPCHAALIALALGRSVGSVDMVYRWGMQPDHVVREKRPDDSFVAQVRRVAKEMGW